MRAFQWLAGVCLLSVAAYGAETRQERGKRVVDEALEALGGQKFLEVKDRVESGRAYSFYRDRLTGLAVSKIYTKYEDQPGANGVAALERQSFGKDEDYYVLFTAKDGYVVTFRGARPLPTERFTRWIESTRRNVLYIFRHRLKEPGLILESQGTMIWQNSPVEIVDITDSDNNVVTVYFHHLTKLPMRQVSIRRDPKTKDRNEEVTVFSKFRDVDGVQWPFNIMSERNGEKVFELYSESVEINTGLDSSLFDLPSKMKVLPPER